MEKLVFGYKCNHEFYGNSEPSEGLGWLYVSAEESGRPCRARFWTDRSRMNAFASAVLEQATSAKIPLETHWEDEQEGRAFHLMISESGTSPDLEVQLRVDRRGTGGGELLHCSFTTSVSDLNVFNAAMTDMISQRRSNATLSGW